MKLCPDCTGETYEYYEFDGYAHIIVLLRCDSCDRKWMEDDDGNLYDPDYPPGPLWSLELHENI